MKRGSSARGRRSELGSSGGMAAVCRHVEHTGDVADRLNTGLLLLLLSCSASAQRYGFVGARVASSVEPVEDV